MVKCEICSEEFRAITWTHLHKHEITLTEYRSQGYSLGNYRGKTFLYRNRATLNHMYWELSMTLDEIAVELEASVTTIHTWMNRLDVPRRPSYYGMHIGVTNHVNLSIRALEFLNGCMLGDGNLASNSKVSARYTHSNKHTGYLEWVEQQLHNFELKTSPRFYKHQWVYRGKPLVAYSLATLTYAELLPLYNCWYPTSSAKLPPGDLQLTPLMLREWYVGDGTLRTYRGKTETSHSVLLCNYSFTRDKKEMLAKQLRLMGLQLSVLNEGFLIRTASTPHFFKLIGDCPVPEIYGYKWPRRGSHEQLRLL